MHVCPHINCEYMIYEQDHWSEPLCFPHDQLYATASWVCSTSKLSMFVPNNQRRNVVY